MSLLAISALVALATWAVWGIKVALLVVASVAAVIGFDLLYLLVFTEDAWQALLLKSLADKTRLLQSTKFRSTGEAAAVLGVGEPAIRKRIRDHRLFALTAPGNDEHRIPVWALGLNAEDTKALIAAQADAWALYLYLETPSGALNGMRPFELLLPTDSLTFEQKNQREALSAFRGLADRGSLLGMVLQDLEADKVPAA